MAEVQLKRKITLRRKEKPAEFTFDGLLKVKLLWQSKTDLDLCIFFKRKDGQIGGVFSSAFRQKKSDLGNLSEFPFMLHKGDEAEPALIIKRLRNVYPKSKIYRRSIKKNWAY